MLNDISILCKEINHYDLLTIPQIMARFHYAKGSYADVTRKLKGYTEQEYLERKLIPHPTLVRGGPSYVYKLGKQGRSLLRAEDIIVPRFTMGHNDEAISKDYWHTIYVNWFFIQAHLWREQQQGVTFLREMHDLDFQRKRKDFLDKVAWDDGTIHTTIPDGFLDVRLPKKRGVFLLELETGSQQEAAIRAKIKTIIYFLKQHYATIFEDDVFTSYLFIAMGLKGLSPEDHQKMLLRTIAQTLREMNLRDFWRYFRVTSCPPDSPSLFTESVWGMPVVDVGYGDYEDYTLFE